MKDFRDGKITTSSPPTWSAAASTSPTSRTSSITICPEDPENYVHRIGRTGRMGADGIAIAFVTREQGEQLTAIETYINHQIEQDSVDGFEALARKVEPEKPEPKAHTPVFGKRIRRYKRGL